MFLCPLQGRGCHRWSGVGVLWEKGSVLSILFTVWWVDTVCLYNPKGLVYTNSKKKTFSGMQILFMYPDLKISHLSYNTFHWNYFLSQKSWQTVDSKLLLFYKCHFYIVVNTTNEIPFTCIVLGWRQISQILNKWNQNYLHDPWHYF